MLYNFLFMYLFLVLMVAFLVLLERKILGLVQIRKSPNIVSFFSLLQTVADGIKLIMKNFILMKKNFFVLFVYSPILAFFLALFNFFFFFLFYTKTMMSYVILFNLFISGLSVYSILGSGWSSSNLYSLIGTIRAVAQMISYEVVLSFFLLLMLLKYNSFSWVSFMNINIFNISFFTFFFFMGLIIFSAELNRTPFDLVEGESELVSSYNVEYSSISFTFLFLAEYLNIWFYSFVLVMIFFKYNMIFFLTFFFVCVFCWVRSMLPRLKFFDLILLMWKTLLPLLSLMYFFFLM